MAKRIISCGSDVVAHKGYVYSWDEERVEVYTAEGYYHHGWDAEMTSSGLCMYDDCLVTNGTQTVDFWK